MAVLNKHKHGIPQGAIYIGRGSKWGNPFVIGIHGNRDEVCELHAEYLRNQVRSGEISKEELAELHGKDLVCFCAPARCHGDTLVRAAAWAYEQLNAQEQSIQHGSTKRMRPSQTIKWSRKGGYECSSKGDKRFSALFAVMPDGRTIEQHYQCDIKGYDVGGRNWRLGKGKPPLDKTKDMWTAYLNLWKQWADANPVLIQELISHAEANNHTLSDMFASTSINQARALAEILNSL